MILTGKEKEDLDEWLWLNRGKLFIVEFGDKQDLLDEFYLYSTELVKNFLIIEWLDSVGIYIYIQLLPHFDESEIVSVCWYANVATSYGCYNSDEHYPTRQQATEQAIIKAVEIYNNRGN